MMRLCPPRSYSRLMKTAIQKHQNRIKTMKTRKLPHGVSINVCLLLSHVRRQLNNNVLVVRFRSSDDEDETERIAGASNEGPDPMVESSLSLMLLEEGNIVGTADNYDVPLSRKDNTVRSPEKQRSILKNELSSSKSKNITFSESLVNPEVKSEVKKSAFSQLSPSAQKRMIKLHSGAEEDLAAIRKFAIRKRMSLIYNKSKKKRNDEVIHHNCQSLVELDTQ